MKTDAFLKKFVIWSLCAGLSVTSLVPSNAATALAADDGADIIALLRNPSKLQEQASKFSRAVDRLRPLANKTVFTDSDLALIDSFIKEKDGGEEVVLHARSKAFAAARGVTAYEQSVKRLAQGQNPQQFIDALEANPDSAMNIPGAGEADAAYQNATRAEASLLDQIGKRLMAQGQRPQSIGSLPGSPETPNRSRVLRVSFSSRVSPRHSAEANYPVAPMVVTNPATRAALIALAAAYLGVTSTRLTTGAIGQCVRRAIREWEHCIRDERNDGSGLSRSERLYCRGRYLSDVSVCVLLPN